MKLFDKLFSKRVENLADFIHIVREQRIQDITVNIDFPQHSYEDGMYGGTYFYHRFVIKVKGRTKKWKRLICYQEKIGYLGIDDVDLIFIKSDTVWTLQRDANDAINRFHEIKDLFEKQLPNTQITITGGPTDDLIQSPESAVKVILNVATKGKVFVSEEKKGKFLLSYKG